MIQEWKTEGVSESLLKHAFDINYGNIQRMHWKTFRPLVFNSMVSVKFGLIPWLKENGYETSNIDDKNHGYSRADGDDEINIKHKLYCKNFQAFVYPDDKIDIFIMQRCGVLSVFMIFKDEAFFKIYGDDEDTKKFAGTSHTIERFGSPDDLHRLINETKQFSGTNMSLDEYKEAWYDLLTHNYLVFDIEQVEDADNEYEGIADLKPLLDEVIKTIKEGDTNSFSPVHDVKKDKVTDGKYLKINEFINTTWSQPEIYEGWEMELFDMNVTQIYTKGNELIHN